MRILVCDADYKHALGIVRMLGRAGHQIFALSPCRGSVSSRSRYCTGELIAPAYDHPAFGQTLLDLVAAHDIELVIPVGTKSFRVLSGIKRKITGRCKIVVADPEAIEFCMSKEQVYHHASVIGIPVPATAYPGSIDSVVAAAEDIQFPCVIKGRHETGFNIVAYASRPEELLPKYRDLCHRFNLTEPDDLPMIQEYIRGEGYGFFAIYCHGRCGCTFQHHRLREYPPTGGASVAAESDRHEAVFQYGKLLLDSLDWHGVAMVEFRVTADGIPMLMEINPKFWGSLDLALAAGVDFPGAMVDIAVNRGISFQREYRLPLKYHWPLHGDLLYAAVRPAAALAVIGDCLNPRVKSNLWLTEDLAGTLGIFRSALRKAFRRLVPK